MSTIPLNPRQQQILERMALDGEVKLVELKAMFDVTEMTLRRDLEKLELAGLLRRTFGGAILIGNDIALKDRTGVMMEEKMRMGQRAAASLQAGESVFIDGGSTTLQIARFLQPEMDITVITNALNIATELLNKQIPTIVVGGMLVNRTATMVGPMTASWLGTMAIDRVFVGTTGLSVKHGFSNSNMHETEIKRLVIRQAAEVNVMMDHTKLGMQDLFSFATIGEVNRLFTDREPAGELAAALRKESVELVLC
ncbi:DeoR/GlpR family DNA-binding transcription regulator [Paenibacillus filicis]|uniref:DeoR/GlpR family DNA-binding transcription regulator n=1 Tax=Paenibacillus filicis TaxID=669464 RepID=A0ABU9DJT3_9BACL